MICSFASILTSLAQKDKADSLSRLLASTKEDSLRANILWQIADAASNYDPTVALTTSRQALSLSKKIKYEEGISRSLGVLANTFVNIGNYPKALDYYFQKLKLEEERNNYRNLASALMNVGVVYVLQEEFPKALQYYYNSDSIIKRYNIVDLEYYSLQNLGDIYDRLNNPDSAFHYFNKALVLAQRLENDNLIGATKTGLAHSYFKIKNYDLSSRYYTDAITLLKNVNNDDLYCEATLGYARLLEEQNQADSAAIYALRSLELAQRDGFLNRQLEAAEFLTSHYSQRKNTSEAFNYLSLQRALNDSLNSKSRIRELQILSTNEQLRQLELEEEKKIARQKRKQELQLLFIGIFIPGLFLFTLLLSKIKIHVRFIKAMGILSLLFLFEYLTLFLHPFVVEITHHTPVLEILIFVCLAAVLLPLHHNFEHKLIRVLTRNRQGKIGLTIKKSALKMRKPLS